ncbi:hypothetical protein ACVBE9_08340 [Eionea flava]
MFEKYFNIIFTGVIRDGFDEVSVKQKAQQIFKIDAAKIATLFSGKATVLKKNVDAVAAQKYQKVLHGIGMQTRVHPCQVAPLSSPSVNHVDNIAEEKSTAIDSLPVSSKVSEDEPLRVLASDEADERIRDHQALTSKNDGHSMIDIPDWDIQQAGEWLTESKPYEGNEVPASLNKPLEGVSLAPVASDLSEREAGNALLEISAPQFLADKPIDSITLSAVGDDLLSSSEQRVEAKASININHLTVEAAEGDLLLPEEKTVFVKKEIETHHLNLESSS